MLPATAMSRLTRKPCSRSHSRAPAWSATSRPSAAPMAVAEERQRARRGDGRIELADRPGGGVARVGEGRQAFGGPRLVEAREGGQRQVHLAAHLDDGRRRGAAEPQRDRVDRPQVGGHVLADRAVAARRADREHAVAIGQRDREAVDLGLDDVAERHVVEPAAFEQAPIARVPGAQLVGVARVGEREHRLEVAHLLELLQRPARRRAGSASRECAARGTLPRAPAARGRGRRTRRR